LPGWCGMMQAMEAAKIILTIGNTLAGRMVLFDMLTYSFRELSFASDPDCAVCEKQAKTSAHQQRDALMKNAYAISAQELKHRLDKHETILLLDVRSPAEHAAQNIGGKLLPLADLPQQLHALTKDHLIICYCHSGIRSELAVHTLLNAGFSKVKSLHGGILAWNKVIHAIA
jgi:sulfur-carrier protein adenylyltransferase/sulfurtransferase